jgi:short subunit dehydrogenase-like uncharacterized protein
MNDLLIYGANGYAGGLIAREAARRGLRPIIAGRDTEAIERLATELNRPHRVFELVASDAAALHLAGARAVMNCAGPFIETATPMIEACLAAKVHYLDITGEIDVIERAAKCRERAVAAGISVISAVGFDVVPSDCLAAMLAAELPTANRLQLAFTVGAVSRGTAKTVLETIAHGGRARVNGRIRWAPVGWKTIDVLFPDGTQSAVSIPWGDVASAYYSTGIPNIETYVALPPDRICRLKRVRWFFPLLRIRPLRRWLEHLVESHVEGPSAKELEEDHAALWGRASDAGGRAVEATMTVPGGYELTVLTALASVERVLAGQTPAGFSTPSRAFGKDFILSIPGTEMKSVGREELEVSAASQ